ncbi:flagellar hook protein FlgE [Plastoroseomonas arctica]|uniref:Flagellar hook protein FlgE n=1 Tax=Plastoroseomonas arctica TaxID=1509237 RepID=A0AAF1K068_9PROT|nr:flagellar hook protein FlgE [Plastoroseomonas arctica]MBR0657376.1 flagellar hook protein FlgE [Plastoroseomonas arctica]
MSLLGSMYTAISGLTAQSRALGHISDNVANSQTVGYKRVDTNFVSFITQSNARMHESGAVQGRPDFQNTIQGAVLQSDNPLAMAVTGNGFFSVVRPADVTGGNTTFSKEQYYTRAGDFAPNEQGYLVNGGGYYLQGWATAANGEPNRTEVSPIRVQSTVSNPVATSDITVSANLPASPSSTDPVSSQINIYDTLGAVRVMQLSWAPVSPNVWSLTVSAPDATPSTLGSIEVNFGQAGSPPAAAGLLASFANASGLVGDAAVAGEAANIAVTADFGQGPQNVNLNLGNFADTNGVTQFAGAEYALRDISQNGVPLGAFTSVAVRDNGDVIVNYDNGRSRVVARVPLVSFNDPDRLDRRDGQAFQRNLESGEARVSDIGSNGAGNVAVGSIESSNVDIASEFSKLIVAQRAYSANTRIITTTDDMLQETLNMKR